MQALEGLEVGRKGQRAGAGAREGLVGKAGERQGRSGNRRAWEAGEGKQIGWAVQEGEWREGGKSEVGEEERAAGACASWPAGAEGCARGCLVRG